MLHRKVHHHTCLIIKERSILPSVRIDVCCEGYFLWVGLRMPTEICTASLFSIPQGRSSGPDFFSGQNECIARKITDVIQTTLRLQVILEMMEKDILSGIYGDFYLCCSTTELALEDGVVRYDTVIQLQRRCTVDIRCQGIHKEITWCIR